ncbi:glycosyltransferase [Dyella sp. M7H15-1]|uniref:glycosyltransferase n=1 Tax=Dyella sp. M7H15-1 TaxID=2501295 RepID=UPI001004E41E|nr:glycosyltransferase [Dyella sp. M7H15-1]QAU25225.1 glycosyltransferase [Dyella sp. M7H15-1]
METFGLIFVLYYPTEAFVGNLHKAMALCRHVIAVDNSSEKNHDLHESLRQSGATVIFNHNQGGLAGAYNRGAELLLEQGCEVIFLLDQDSLIEEQFFLKMMQACAGLAADKFIVGPKVYEINLQRCMPVTPPGKKFPKPFRIDNETDGLFPTLFVISSGSAISAQVYRTLGAFREDYFIECIDVEYGLRATSSGIPVYMNAAVTMRQTTGRIERHGKLFTTNHAAWRRYYGTRNAVHSLRLYRSKWSLHWLSGLLAIHWAFCVVLFEPQKLRKLVAMVAGYVDGRFGMLGTFESRHPRIAAFCKRPAREPIIIRNHSSATVE